jgi:spore coat protein CotH
MTPVRRLLGAGVILGLAAAVHAAAPSFDQSILHDTRIVIDPNDWRALQENFRTNQYYACDLTLDGETLRQVGIRSRGAGSRDAVKPGLRVDFNRFVTEQQFHGYKTLVLDNLVQDPSMLRERLAFEVFEAMGIPAPQNAFTRLHVNGEYWGVYALVEAVSKRFLESRLGEDGGNLFDYEWASPYDFSYLGPDPSLYVPVPFEPETNEDSLDPGELVGFIRAINETPDETLLEVLESYLDLETFLTYVAVENAIAENDGLAGFDGVNNFYLYQYVGNRFVFIPWDKDNAFLDANWPVFQNVEANVLLRRLLGAGEPRAIYLEQLVRAVESFVNTGWLTPRLEMAYTQIREAAIEDKKKPYSNEEFEIGVNHLRAVVEGRRQDVLNQVR